MASRSVISLGTHSHCGVRDSQQTAECRFNARQQSRAIGWMVVWAGPRPGPRTFLSGPDDSRACRLPAVIVTSWRCACPGARRGDRPGRSLPLPPW
jgi:hypothetical protein